MNALFMGQNFGAMVAERVGISPVVIGIMLAAVAIWSLAWKGFALWYAARNHQKKWFIVILILNTVGILEIVYLLWFRRDKKEGVTTSLFNNPLPEENVEEVASAPQA